MCVARKVSLRQRWRGGWLVEREKVSEVERGSKRRRGREDRDQNNKQLLRRVGPLAGESRGATR